MIIIIITTIIWTCTNAKGTKLKRPISYLVLPNKLSQNSLAWNNKHLLNHMISVGQELGRGLAGWSCLKVSQEVAVKMRAWAAATSGLLCGWTISFQAGSFTPWQAVSRRPQFLTTWASPQGCSTILTTKQLPSPRASDPREHGRSHSVFYDILWKVTHCHSHDILLVTQVHSIQCGRELDKGVNTTRV